jgi:capsular exopolysaccharide synthesis family protein
LERRSPAAEEYRTIRSAISLGSEEWRGGFVVSSPSRGDGKSTIAANLAISWAQAGASVCLVDADLRDGSLARQFGEDSKIGLADVLSGTAGLDETLKYSTEAGISILPAGELPADPPSLLGSERMSQLVRALRSRFEVVIYDSPAMMSVTDALVLSEKIGGLILVARSGVTRSAHLATTIESVDAAGQRLIGAVIAGVKPRRDVTGQYWSKTIAGHRVALRENHRGEPAAAPHVAAYEPPRNGTRATAALPAVSTSRSILTRTAGVDRAFS